MLVTLIELARMSTPTPALRIVLALPIELARMSMLTHALVIAIGATPVTAIGRPTATRPGPERTSTIA